MTRWIAAEPGVWTRRLGDSDVRLRDRGGWWTARWSRVSWGASGDTARDALEDLSRNVSGSQRRTLRRWAATLPPEIGGAS